MVASRINHEVVYFKNRYNPLLLGFAFRPRKCTTFLQEFICKIFFLARTYQEYNQDFASNWYPCWDPGGDFFLGRIPVRTEFLAGFLPWCAGGTFPGRDPPNCLLQRDLGSYFTRDLPTCNFLLLHASTKKRYAPWSCLPLFSLVCIVPLIFRCQDSNGHFWIPSNKILLIMLIAFQFAITHSHKCIFLV